MAEKINALQRLMSTLQGASNTAADTVAAPVDGLAWLLRRAGVPVPEAPVGGSAWMERQGLRAEPQDRASGLVGEFLGMTSPVVAAAKGPQAAVRAVLPEFNVGTRDALLRSAQTQDEMTRAAWQQRPRVAPAFNDEEMRAIEWLRSIQGLK